MAIIDLTTTPQQPRYNGGSGNTITEVYSLVADASGKVNGNSVNIGDVIRLGVLPAGWELQPADLEAFVSAAFTASSTAKLGFAYVDGVDSTAFPQNDGYFIAAGQSLASQAVVRGGVAGTRPQTLPKDAYLILTWAGANNAAAGRLDVAVNARNRGVA